MAEDALLEIRRLSYHHKQGLGNLLQINHGWREVMGGVRSLINRHHSRFTVLDIDIIEQEAGNSMELFIEEWGTMYIDPGAKRLPNVQDLMDLCIRVGQIAAASYISEIILGQGPIDANAHPGAANNDDDAGQADEVINGAVGGGGGAALISNHYNDVEVTPEQFEQSLNNRDRDDDSELLEMGNSDFIGVYQ
jgi:hypothetical protein